MVPYPTHSGHSYGQQYYYSSAPYGTYDPYGSGQYWVGLYDPRLRERNSLGGWSLGLGIASIFAGCFCWGIFLGLSAVLLGIKGVAAANNGCATNKKVSIAGLVLGSIGSAISVAVFFFSFFLLLIDLP